MDFAKMSITKVKQWLDQLSGDLPAETEQLLLSDKRKGVLDLVKIYHQKREAQQKLAQKWQEMSQHERQLREQGNRIIIGIDEVGRGPLAGPVVACAVALPEDFYLPGLNDSKKVPLATREAFYEIIKRDALHVGVGIVDAKRIDEINILEATREAMILAVQDAGCTPDVCLIDAVHIPNMPYRQIPIIGGDGKSISIAAASIVAKVTRDKLMEEWGNKYPGYGFEKNAGYGTAEHMEAIRRLGPSPIHRMSFGGVKEEQIG
ncbi:ribonuclease HII [Brevibacillus sp. SYSU BS000544]|uniref:ribonuclease HII n=1 Tax=Brevibacillus sp. SYSU BS000544 TaxID=3416443 RepID=UPI003CE4F755